MPNVTGLRCNHLTRRQRVLKLWHEVGDVEGLYQAVIGVYRAPTDMTEDDSLSANAHNSTDTCSKCCWGHWQTVSHLQSN